MKVIGERPSLNRFHRFLPPLNTTLPSGASLVATNWNLGGVRLDRIKSEAPSKGEMIGLILSLLFPAFDVSFEVIALVTDSNTEEGMLGCEFQELSERPPVAIVKMPIDGIVRPVQFEIGAIVKEGQEIARIENANFQNRLEDREIELAATIRDLKRAEEKYRIEQSRMKLHQVFNCTDHQVAKARVAFAREALEAADTAYEWLAVLFKEKLVTASKLELSIKERTQAETRLKDAERELERTTAMERAAGLKQLDHKEFVDCLDKLTLDIVEANSAVKTAQMQLKKMERQRSVMSVSAPSDGKIVSVQQAAHTIGLRDEPLLTIEQRIASSVTDFLDQALKVGSSDKVKVFLPSLMCHAEAVVERIERNSTFINSDCSDYSWKEGREINRALSIQMNLDNFDRDDVKTDFPVGEVFAQKQVNDLYPSIESRLL